MVNKMELNKVMKCKECGNAIHPLAVFPKGRCLECHAKAPEVIRMSETMTGAKLARMWGA